MKLRVAVLEATLGDEGSEKPLLPLIVLFLLPWLWYEVALLVAMLNGAKGKVLMGEDSRDVSEKSVVSDI